LHQNSTHLEVLFKACFYPKFGIFLNNLGFNAIHIFRLSKIYSKSEINLQIIDYQFSITTLHLPSPEKTGKKRKFECGLFTKNIGGKRYNEVWKHKKIANIYIINICD